METQSEQLHAKTSYHRRRFDAFGLRPSLQDGNGSQKGSQRGSLKENFGSQKGSHLGQVSFVFL